MKPKKTKKKLTDDEIDALVIADADDDSAWGDPIVVPASKSPRPAWMTESKPASKRPEESRPRHELTGGVRGKYVTERAKGTSVAVIAPDLARIFPDSESVNEALRTLVRISGKGSRLTKSAKPRT